FFRPKAAARSPPGTSRTPRCSLFDGFESREEELREQTVLRRLALFVAVCAAATIGVWALPGYAHATDCAGPDPLTATTDNGLKDIVNTGGTCTAANGDTVTIAPGLYAPDAPLTVTQTNLTIQGPQSGAGVVILGSNNGAGTKDIIDVQA